MFAISKGIYDSKKQLIGFVTFELEIGFLKRLIVSSLSSEYPCVYSVYTSDLKYELISKDLKLTKTEMTRIGFDNSIFNKTIDGKAYTCKK